MKEVTISLNTVDKVKRFVDITSKQIFDCDIVSGRYIIDAKSIMGILSIDLSKDLTLQIYSDDETEIERFTESISEFII